MGDKILFVVGVPGTGKTTLSKKLELKGICYRVKINPENGILASWDPLSQSLILNDEHLLIKAILHKWENFQCIIIETHTPGILSNVITPTHIVILRTNPLILYERLRSKGWGFRKILENVEAEYLGIPSLEVRKLYNYTTSKILEIDTSGVKSEELVDHLMDFLHDGGSMIDSGYIDWTATKYATDIESLIFQNLKIL
ncbi:MAG: AAA family ATPase [Desulfurococcales archaeon]|nr:AAA family ATPase [Desulfurococcales archaeon]